eukprot:CAMPEP_0201542884 /NCGR_PEP_ID=MMETSP0161_2-20130828/72277_1 /ASSEMBLY_ACC=CAM_ASM_000251 /TAXON_ID=180227 /ORGANISM="Neoparamoeba aestuarina, Strain SoJaBio B1-5/56/2" /LENGTH=389 /DNA_ID=CAMNT_0047950573 /DNA_START=1242 /DNA_END=2408 /DNA_ORIENTATION=+
MTKTYLTQLFPSNPPSPKDKGPTPLSLRKHLSSLVSSSPSLLVSHAAELAFVATILDVLRPPIRKNFNWDQLARIESSLAKSIGEGGEGEEERERVVYDLMGLCEKPLPNSKGKYLTQREMIKFCLLVCSLSSHLGGERGRRGGEEGGREGGSSFFSLSSFTTSYPSSSLSSAPFHLSTSEKELAAKIAQLEWGGEGEGEEGRKGFSAIEIETKLFPFFRWISQMREMNTPSYESLLSSSTVPFRSLVPWLVSDVLDRSEPTGEVKYINDDYHLYADEYDEFEEEEGEEGERGEGGHFLRSKRGKGRPECGRGGGGGNGRGKPGKERIGGSLTNILSAGVRWSIDGVKAVTARNPRPIDNESLVVFVIGGMTCDELHQIREVVGERGGR